MNADERRFRPGFAGLAAALASLIAVPAAAACREPASDEGEAVAAAVVGGDPKVFFVQDGLLAAGCPNASARCRTKAYVMNGDVVLVGARQGDYRCASFTNARGISTTNWLPAAALAALAPKPPDTADWVGHWVRVEAEIMISSAGKPGQLRLRGTATYGAFDPDRVRRGAVNMGDFESTATPENGRLAFTMAGDTALPYDQGDPMDCRVRLSLVGPYLLAKDNDNCGGHNVTFSGVYRREGQELGNYPLRR